MVRWQHIKLVTPPYVTVGQARFRMAADQTKRLGYRGHLLARALTAYPLCVTRYADLGALRSMCRAQLSDRELRFAERLIEGIARAAHRRGSDHVRDRSTRLCEDVLCGHRRFDP